MKRILVTVIALFSLVTIAVADNADRGKLIGSWSTSGGSSPSNWTFTESTKGLHIVQTEGGSTIGDFDCSVDGRACDVKLSGHKASLSFYYNGAALVELETKGDKIVKRLFSVGPSGNELKIEITPMTGKNLTTSELELVRGSAPAPK